MFGVLHVLRTRTYWNCPRHLGSNKKNKNQVLSKRDICCWCLCDNGITNMKELVPPWQRLNLLSSNKFAAKTRISESKSQANASRTPCPTLCYIVNSISAFTLPMPLQPLDIYTHILHGTPITLELLRPLSSILSDSLIVRKGDDFVRVEVCFCAAVACVSAACAIGAFRVHSFKYMVDFPSKFVMIRPLLSSLLSVLLVDGNWGDCLLI